MEKIVKYKGYEILNVIKYKRHRFYTEHIILNHRFYISGPGAMVNDIYHSIKSAKEHVDYLIKYFKK